MDKHSLLLSITPSLRHMGNQVLGPLAHAQFLTCSPVRR